jgi:hypothetical protein
MRTKRDCVCSLVKKIDKSEENLWATFGPKLRKPQGHPTDQNRYGFREQDRADII